MTFPIQITFRGMEASSVLEEAVHEKAADLQKYSDRIVHCRVAIEAPSGHHRHGQHYHVTVELGVPGHELVASRDPDEHAGNEDAHVAIRDAFRAAKAELQRYVGRRREQQKHGNRIAEELGS